MERTLPPLHLSQSPLLLVLAQVRFSPILQMDKFIPEIQERLRSQGFPKFQAATEATSIQIPGMPALSQNPTVHWEFMDPEGRKSIVVGTESVAFTVTDYSTFEDFRVGLQIALLTVHEAVKLPLRTRVGLRYIDLLIPKEGKEVSDYVRLEILGLLKDKLPLQRLAYVSQLLCESKIGKFILRCTHQIGGSVLPPDLQLLRLTVKKPLLLNQEFCVLDFDHFLEEQSEFDLATVSTDFNSLHDVLDQGFRAVVTPEALKEWE
jgi:uncharacterized protein (TIGR04255 family)